MTRPHRDDRGRLRAGADETVAAHGDFLETGIGENAVAFEDLSRGLDQICTNTCGHWEFHGNVYTLRLRPEGARLTNAHDGRAPSLALPLSALESVLRERRCAWTRPS